MKIKVIIPNSGMKEDTLLKREEMLSKAVSESVEVSVECIKRGPDVIQSYTDEVMASEVLIEQSIEAMDQGFDAIVIYCFSDVGLNAIRENVNIPVIGPGESSLAWAALFGYPFIVITTTETNIPRTYERLMKNPFAREHMTSIRSLDITVQNLREAPTTTISRLRDVIKKSMHNEKIESVILGCLGLAEYGEPLQNELNIKIIDPAFVALSLAETAVRLSRKRKCQN